MIVQLKYGDGRLEAHCRLNGSMVELHPHRITSLQRAEDQLRSALERPVVAYPFKRVFRRAKNLLLILPATAPENALQIMARTLVETLNQIFVPDEEIKIFIANASPRPFNQRSLQKLVGAEISARFAVFQNDPNDTQAFEYIGETRRGTPVFINRHLLEADELILCGTIAHHFLTGYTGGPELLVPGCAGAETINRIGQLAFRDLCGRADNCMDGVFEGNPIYQEIRDAYKGISPRYGLFAIVNGNDRIIAAFAGNPLQAHIAGCHAVDRLNRLPIARKADFTIVGAGGAPKDTDFLQAFTALHHARAATREGGILIFVAACSQGIGTPGFIDQFDLAKNGTLPLRPHALAGFERFIARSTMEIACRQNVFFVSNLAPDLVQKIGFTPFSDFQQAVDAAMDRLPPRPLTYIIPDGSIAVPHYKKTEKVPTT